MSLFMTALYHHRQLFFPLIMKNKISRVFTIGHLALKIPKKLKPSCNNNII